MIVSVAELKNGIEQYLELVGEEEILITMEGRNVAQLAPPPKEKDKLAILESLCGILPPTATVEEALAERLISL